MGKATRTKPSQRDVAVSRDTVGPVVRGKHEPGLGDSTGVGDRGAEVEIAEVMLDAVVETLLKRTKLRSDVSFSYASAGVSVLVGTELLGRVAAEYEAQVRRDHPSRGFLARKGGERHPPVVAYRVRR